MKFLSRPVWSEGMYLAPHHFQAQSRYFDDSIAFLASGLWSEPWGFLYLEMDAKAISNGSASLLHASGIFADGLTFDMPTSDAVPATRDLALLFEPSATELLLYLMVPGRRNDGYDANISHASGDSRYLSAPHTLRDETNGLDEREVLLARKNIHIVTANELTPGMISLPLARVVRDGRGELTYDDEFVPASLRVSASPALMSMLKRLIDTIGEKSATILRGAQRPERFEPGISALDIANYWFLHSLHTALPPLRHLIYTRHAHPADCFLEVSRLAGALCTFSVDSSPRLLPDYNHGDPGPIFRALIAHIRHHLEIVVPSNAVTLTFTSAGAYLHQAVVIDERCLHRSRWILGVRSSIGESEQLQLVPRLIKICSARFVPELVKRALPGMTLMHLPVPPTAIRAVADMQYFSIDTSGACWEHILQTKSVGIYIPGEIADPEFTLIAIVETAS
ncbi:type VI secretion system baseplate subunit TssK [Granulicella sp. L60]|uniref:type VI secretion system baseplate subunit TssK n=1 Tax=Granulicella sp. L60 TaxID=1641866 RepID=UPI00131E37DF|nr:type VI secretion system baseplate subunit TssK [Granulicella sp. L60]